MGCWGGGGLGGSGCWGGGVWWARMPGVWGVEACWKLRGGGGVRVLGGGNPGVWGAGSLEGRFRVLGVQGRVWGVRGPGVWGARVLGVLGGVGMLRAAEVQGGGFGVLGSRGFRACSSGGLGGFRVLGVQVSWQMEWGCWGGAGVCGVGGFGVPGLWGGIHGAGGVQESRGMGRF